MSMTPTFLPGLHWKSEQRSPRPASLVRTSHTRGPRAPLQALMQDNPKPGVTKCHPIGHVQPKACSANDTTLAHSHARHIHVVTEAVSELQRQGPCGLKAKTVTGWPCSEQTALEALAASVPGQNFSTEHVYRERVHTAT